MNITNIINLYKRLKEQFIITDYINTDIVKCSFYEITNKIEFIGSFYMNILENKYTLFMPYNNYTDIYYIFNTTYSTNINGHQILSERVNKQCICCIKLSEKFKNIKFSIIVDNVKLDKIINYNINEYKILEDIINNFHINIDKDLLFSAIQLGELKLWN